MLGVNFPKENFPMNKSVDETFEGERTGAGVVFS